MSFEAYIDRVMYYYKSQASEKLEVRGLLGLACRALADKIKGKSPRETCHILDIKGVFDDANHDLKLVEKALAALNIVRCQDFTQYEPKLNAFKCSRYHNFENLAFFDFDKECECSIFGHHHQTSSSSRSALHDTISIYKYACVTCWF